MIASPDAASEMSIRAREIFEAKYTAEENLKLLMAIYGRAREDFENRRKG